jgi:surfactin synthase thioesterase subunit
MLMPFSRKLDKKITEIENQIKHSGWHFTGLSLGAATSFEYFNFSDFLSLEDQPMHRQKRAKKGGKEKFG